MESGIRVSSRSIKSDLAKIDSLKGEEIDYVDSPELDDSFFTRPLADWPARKESITIRLDSDVVERFRSQCPGYQPRINQLLRRYVEAQKALTR